MKQLFNSVCLRSVVFGQAAALFAAGLFACAYTGNLFGFAFAAMMFVIAVCNIVQEYRVEHSERALLTGMLDAWAGNEAADDDA
jgi:hypothetical protein